MGKESDADAALQRLMNRVAEKKAANAKRTFSEWVASASFGRKGSTYVTSSLLGYTVVMGRIPSPMHEADVEGLLSKETLAMWPPFYRVAYVLYPAHAPELTAEEADVFEVHGGVTFNEEFLDGRAVGFDTHHGWEEAEHQTDEYVMGELGELIAQMTAHRKKVLQ